MFKNKRIIAIAMTLLMVVSMLPGMAFAEGGQNLQSYITNKYTVQTFEGKDFYYDEENGKYNTDDTTRNTKLLQRYGQVEWQTIDNKLVAVSQYFFHGADIENGSKPTPNNPYVNTYVNDSNFYNFNYTVKTNTAEQSFYDNYVSDANGNPLKSDKEIVFAVFYAGGQTKHLYDEKDASVIKNCILDHITLKSIDGKEDKTKDMEFYTDIKVVEIKAPDSGIGNERTAAVIITIPEGTLTAGQTYKLRFDKVLKKGTDISLMSKDIVFTFAIEGSNGSGDTSEESVKLNKRNLTLETNETAQLTATLGGTPLKENDVTWTSSNENVAEVSKSGKVTPVAKGETEITVTTITDKKTAKCKVTVVEPAQQIPAERIVIKETNISMNVGETRSLPEVEITPADSTDTVTWTSSEESILDVKNAKKQMVGKKSGTVTLTAKISDTITATCTVTVKGTLESNPDSDYKIINGANSTWKPSSDGTLTIRGDGDFSKFQEVKVDGQEVARTNYEVSEGSTIITFKQEFLNTLSAGNHTVEIVWTDGSATTNFTVDKAADNTTDKATDKSTQTGDNMNMTLYVVLMLVALAAAAGVVVYRRQRQ